jgi:accessory gene regulator protein AgrB
VPPIVWGLGAVAGLFLAGLCVATGYAVLRARTRALIAQWSIARIVARVVIAAIPWLVVWLAPINISMNIHALPALIGWLALALLAFGVLVLLPLAAVLAASVWLTARRRGVTGMRQNDEQGV